MRTADNSPSTTTASRTPSGQSPSAAATGFSSAPSAPAAAIQSLLATAKLNGLEPYAWLKNTLEKLPAWPNSRIDEHLPLNKSDSNVV
jgi:hypothetical protein